MTDFAHPQLVSVVVIGRNEGDRLARCLQSVAIAGANMKAVAPAQSNLLSPHASHLDQDRFSLELIYVDSGSTDNSVAIAESLGAQALALTPDRPTAALGRNAGWRAAHGEIVLFLDGDTELDPAFITAALPSFADPKVAVVWGHRREKHPELSLYDRTLDLDWIYPPGPAAFCGGDALFRRDVLAAAGGFDDTLVAGEEPELCGRILALDYEVLHVDLPMTRHVLGIRTFKQYWKRATRAGHAYAEVAARFAGTAHPLWSADARRNQVRAALLVAIASAALAATLFERSVVPVAYAIGVYTLLILRTAWKARWKSKSPLTLLLYGLHSHFQQIPIAWGQLQFAANRRRGHRAAVFEYKSID